MFTPRRYHYATKKHAKMIYLYRNKATFTAMQNFAGRAQNIFDIYIARRKIDEMIRATIQDITAP